METAATALRGLHIVAGLTALISMWVPLVTAKGNKAHRRAGKVYVVAMVCAAVAAIVIAPVRMAQRPQAEWGSPIFLAYLGLLSINTSLFGVRVLRMKRVVGAVTGADRVLPAGLLVTAVAMGVYGLLNTWPLAIIFAALGLLVAVPQWRLLQRLPTQPAWWVPEHLSAMLVSCIATLTAFLVVNASRFLEGPAMLAVWVAPTVVGTVASVRWRRRYQKAPAG